MICQLEMYYKLNFTFYFNLIRLIFDWFLDKIDITKLHMSNTCSVAKAREQKLLMKAKAKTNAASANLGRWQTLSSKSEVQIIYRLIFGTAQLSSNIFS